MIVLVGFMGAGKTTVGRLLSGQLGLPFIDADAVIEERAGCPVPQIFADQGEQAFRAIEHETIAALLGGPDVVLALGGGAVEHPETRRLLLTADVVYLHVPYAGALARVGGDDGRPMLRRPDLAAVYRRRLATYEAIATHTVPTDGREAADVCGDITGRLGPAVPRRTGNVHLSAERDSVRVGRKARACGSECRSTTPEASPRRSPSWPTTRRPAWPSSSSRRPTVSTR